MAKKGGLYDDTSFWPQDNESNKINSTRQLSCAKNSETESIPGRDGDDGISAAHIGPSPRQDDPTTWQGFA